MNLFEFWWSNHCFLVTESRYLNPLLTIRLINRFVDQIHSLDHIPTIYNAMGEREGNYLILLNLPSLDQWAREHPLLTITLLTIIPSFDHLS